MIEPGNQAGQKIIRPSTAPSQGFQNNFRNLGSARYDLDQEMHQNYDKLQKQSKQSVLSKAINEDDDEDQADFDDENSSSLSDRRESLKKSSDIKGHFNALRDENEELKRDYEILQDKYKSMEDEMRNLEMQNKTQKLEIDMLNKFVEINKQAIMKTPDCADMNSLDKNAE